MKLPDIEFAVERNDLSLALVGLENITVEKSRSGWDEIESNLFEKMRSVTTLEDVKHDPIFASYRELYWNFGMDPTKLRVSSEALLRRIVNGLNLWRISNIVDVVNVASPMHKIPIGLVDVSKVVGQLIVRVAFPQEIFVRIGGTEKVCRGREIVLADEEKIICFGYATHDSEYTKVATNSQDVYVLLYGAPAVTEEYLESAANDTLALIHDWVDCTSTMWRFYRS